MAKVHVIPHTHWDREWYFTQQDSDVLATYNFTKVIETLESQSSYSCYHLDGQSAIVEDYLKVMPHMRERMAKLVSDKRLFIGPWYTQTDTFNVAGESIIRNLKYGMHVAEQLGHSMTVGYLPDTFGHNAQMPTLFKGCGIDNIIFWRGIDYDQQVERSNFFWQSPGGDSIIAYNLVHGYGAAKNIVAEPAHLDNKIFPMVEKIKALAGLDEVLIPSGGDQVNIDPNLPETLAKATERSSAGDTYVISSMEDYVDYLRHNSSDFDTYQGEFKIPRYTRIHKTIGSVRYDIKKLNFEIEQFLLKKLELVTAIAKAHGITVHTELIDIAWKKIIECHAHDSMGGCNSDATNADIMHRLKQAEEICHGLYNLIVKDIASQVCDEGEIIVFNNRIKPHSGIADIVVFSTFADIALTHNGQPITAELVKRDTLDGGKVIEVTKDGEKEVPVPPYYRFELKAKLDDIPALGYLTLRVGEASTMSQAQPGTSAHIENSRLRLTLDNGELILTDKQSGRTISDLIQFENQADDGDSYDFSPLEGDTPLYSQPLSLLGTQHGELIQQMTLQGRILVPQDLEDRRQGDANSEIVFKLTFTLHHGERNLQVDIDTVNHVKDHRVRVLINSDINTDSSVSTLPFATIERPIAPVLFGAEENWRERFRECPVDIETTEGAVAIANDADDKQTDRALIINGRGIKEYQILKTNQYDRIALTLFKAVGYLGKDELLWRPGRASGINNTVVHTPDAQLQQSMRFSFAIAMAESTSHQAIRELETEYLNQPFSYQRQRLNSFENRLERFQVRFDAKPMSKQFSLLNIKEELELSSLSHSFYENNALVLRLFNPTEQAITLDMTQFDNYADVAIVNYREQLIAGAEPVVAPNNTIDLRLRCTAATPSDKENC
ncbi:glycoside hydrolase family 38 C-terminal domain-containing protein (plasmid) [Photobacterium sp. DA100]|uniref:glycoside hydrolase family 38 N-terminal domain-containing protein n=1 Tax=Photobacterium sp. DA100 TaxID=3027472 RepID=UPI00247B2D62|nr:glycoside hydrolase family 38 C-terminal domain-containing protein [Photobacterium sp. DA100]WEM44830.1 glycoside hydrolase family 38 C-terminal domain-containing protein [Photobacterium sp. DA100]